MTVRFLSLIVILMIYNSSIAQKRHVETINWTIGARLPGENGKMALGIAGPVSGACGSVLFVGGGANFPDSMPWQGGKKKYYDEIFVFREVADNIVLCNKRFKLPFTVAYAACTSTDQGVVYAGGENENGISDKVFLLQWDKINSSVVIKNLPDLPLPLTNAAATSIGNRVYVSGGEAKEVVSDHFYLLNLDNTIEGWKQLPSLPQAVSHAVMAALTRNNSGFLFLISGRKRNTNAISDLYSSVFEFDIQKNQWAEKKSLPYAVSAGTGISWGEENILLFSGDIGETFSKIEKLNLAISSEKNEQKKKEITAEKIALLNAHPGFSKEVLLYIVSTDEWKVIGEIPFDSPVTTTAVEWNKKIIIPSGEIRAGVRTPQILMGSIYVIPDEE